MIIDVVGFVLMAIPYFFWDYDTKKQNLVMEVLKRRAEVTAKQATEAGEKTQIKNSAFASNADAFAAAVAGARDCMPRTAVLK